MGSAKAQYYVGTYYKEGHVVSVNYATAANWYRRSADSGFAPAQFEYGILLKYGLGITQDVPGGIGYIGRAADAGIPEAQFTLGNYYLTSPDEKSPQKAEQWLKSAAEKRYGPAEYCLANEYISGANLTSDYVAADVLLRDLKNRGFRDAEADLDNLESYLMTPDQVASATSWAGQHP